MSFKNAITRAQNKLAGGMDNTQDGVDASKELPDLFTRDIGGEWRTNQPFFTGYHQVLFTLPDKLFGNESNIASKWLTGTCENFTPHTVTPNFIDVMGVGQTGASFMTGKTIGREFTLAFREFQNMPIMSIIDLWHSVFDSHMGVSALSGNEFIPLSYKGSCIVFQLKPTGGHAEVLGIEDIEEVYAYHGVFPKTNPRDTVGASDQTANDTIQLSVTFSFDGAPLTLKDNIGKKAIAELNEVAKYSTTHKLYQQAFTGDAATDNTDDFRGR